MVIAKSRISLEDELDVVLPMTCSRAARSAPSRTSSTSLDRPASVRL